MTDARADFEAATKGAVRNQRACFGTANAHMQCEYPGELPCPRCERHFCRLCLPHHESQDHGVVTYAL